MTLPQITEPAPIAANARCATCRAPLATDQLFCLSCGTRRRDARIAFRDVLATEAAPVVANGGGGWPPNGVAEAPTGPGPVGPGRITYVPFLATLALLLFALAVGVWVGRKPVQAVAGPTAPVAAVQAVQPTTPTGSEEDAAATEGDDAAEKSSDEQAAEEEAPAPVKDDTSALKNLEKLSPEEYQKQSQKLPDEIGTGGAPPPKDDKPAGGGSDVEVFE